MAFVEITPPPKGTGVRIGNGDRSGMTVSLTKDVARHLDIDADQRVRVLFEADPACPMIRIEAADDGPYRLRAAARGDGYLLRLGQQPRITGGTVLKSSAATWEAVEGKRAIDIDLPREFVRRETETRYAPGSKKPITLPKVAAE